MDCVDLSAYRFVIVALEACPGNGILGPIWAGVMTAGRSTDNSTAYSIDGKFGVLTNPCPIDDRFARPKLVQGPSSPVQFIAACSETRSLKDFVGIAVGLCPLSQERDHQFLGFNEARGEIVPAQFAKSSLCFGYQFRLSEIAEVPRDAVESEADVQPVCRCHCSEPRGKLHNVCCETAVRGVGISRGTSGQEFLKPLHQTGIILLQRWPLSLVGGFAHRPSIGNLRPLVLCVKRHPGWARHGPALGFGIHAAKG